MHELSIRTRFSAAHHLVDYPGSCASPHGHNWEVEVFVRGRELDGTGILLDFHVLRKKVAAILGEMDHSDLNEVDAFGGANPTSENIARLLYGRLAASLNSDRCRVHRVTVSETPESRSSYWKTEAS